MVRKLALLALTLLLLVPDSGRTLEMQGKFGIGYFRSEIPVGIRYWMRSKAAIDVGFGFESEDMGDTRANSLRFGFGLPFILHQSKHANFNLRIGWIFGFFGDGSQSWHSVEILGAPGVEVFISDHLSLEASHGILVEISTLPEVYGNDTFINFHSFSGNITQLGFHYYFN